MRISIGRIGDVLASAEMLLVRICLAMLLLVVIIQVFSRNLGYYTPWSQDMALLFFTWLTFVGASLAVRRGMHYQIDVWSKRMVRFKRGLCLSGAVGIAIFTLILIWQGFKMTWLVRGRISGAGEISMAYYFISLPLASILTLFHLVEATFLEWESLGK